VLLAYLIDWLKKEGFISKKTGRDSAIRNHFVSENWKPIKNAKQSLKNMRLYNYGELPRKFEIIEPLLKELKIKQMK
jgi:hypothetical protein